MDRNLEDADLRDDRRLRALKLGGQKLLLRLDIGISRRGPSLWSILYHEEN